MPKVGFFDFDFFFLNFKSQLTSVFVKEKKINNQKLPYLSELFLLMNEKGNEKPAREAGLKTESLSIDLKIGRLSKNVDIYRY